MPHLKKRHIALGFFLLAIMAVLFFLSGIARNWLIHNSEKLIGRKIEIGELHFNYAKVAVQVKDFVLYEKKQPDKFVTFNELYLNFDPWTLIKGEYSFSEIRIMQPVISIVHHGEQFNFDSLIPVEDSSKVEVKEPDDEILKFTIHNIRLAEGKVDYLDMVMNNHVEMKNLNLELPLISWNNKSSDVGLTFNMGNEGEVNLQARVDNINQEYIIDLTTRKLEIKPLLGYLQDYLDLVSIDGFLSSQLKIKGDLNDIMNINIGGNTYVENLSLIDGRAEEILAAPRVSANISNINLKSFHFGFGKIEASEPKLAFVIEKDMSNLERLFQPYFLSDTLNTTLEDEAPVTYRIDSIKIDKGQILISDKTLNRPFHYDINDMDLTMVGLSENAEHIPVVFDTRLNNRGRLTGKTVWSMTDYYDLEMDARLEKLDLMSFSPYSEYFIASPITQGWFNYDLSLQMSKTSLKNRNNFKIEELEFGKRTKDTSAVKVPVRLGLYLMKDAKDNIAFDIPVEGNPSEPKFKLGKIIWKAFANLMVKAAGSPFKAMAGLAGNDPESLEKLPFALAQDSLDASQRAKLAQLATILKKKPDLNLTFIQTTDPETEKAKIALELVKKNYLQSKSSGQIADGNELKDDDPELLNYIRNSVPAVDSIGVMNASRKMIDSGTLDSRLQQVIDERNRKLTEYLTIIQGIPLESVNVTTADFRNMAQEIRIPQFKVEVMLK